MSNRSTILLVEDELALGGIVAENLNAVGFHVTHVQTGSQALELLKDHEFSLLILDVMMPGMDGFSVARQIRVTNTAIPILFVTSKTMPHDVVEGFESGGNDYLKKPFAMQELVVRIRVLLSDNRLLNKSNESAVVAIGAYIFDPVKQQLGCQGLVKQLTARESEILWLLYQHRQSLIGKKNLLETIWGDDNFFNSRTLDVFITRLRKHLKQDHSVQIINVRGVGYKLVW